jgi:hypothetical protein
MKHLLFSFLFAFFLKNSQAQLLVSDSFANRSKFSDNSLLALWGSNGTATTGFNLTTKTDVNGRNYAGLVLTSDAMANNGYVASNSLKTLTSIDYTLPQIDRELDTVTIEFDALWETTSNGGENGRLVVTLLGDYPAGGPQFNDVNDTLLDNPFGKPLYNIRIRNTSGANGPLMLYGAGTVPAPAWEIYKNTSAPTVGWWLPGFSVQAGGGSPGSGPDYPGSGTKKSSLSITGIEVWKHYTWKIMPERMELYYRVTTQPASANVLLFFMQVPRNTSSTYVVNQVNAAHGTSISSPPPNYNWFRYANAIRFYWRGGDSSWLSNVTVRRQTAILPVSPIESFSAVANGGKAVIQAQAGTGYENLRFVLERSANGIVFNGVTSLQSFTTAAGKIMYADEMGYGLTRYYRIKITNTDGTVSYTAIKKVSTVSSGGLQVSGGKGQVTIQQAPAESATVDIYSTSGKLVSRRSLSPGSSTIIALPEGVYVYRAVTGSGNIIKGKLLVQ